MSIIPLLQDGRTKPTRFKFLVPAKFDIQLSALGVYFSKPITKVVTFANIKTSKLLYNLIVVNCYPSFKNMPFSFRYLEGKKRPNKRRRTGPCLQQQQKSTAVCTSARLRRVLTPRDTVCSVTVSVLVNFCPSFALLKLNNICQNLQSAVLGRYDGLLAQEEALARYSPQRTSHSRRTVRPCAIPSHGAASHAYCFSARAVRPSQLCAVSEALNTILHSAQQYQYTIQTFKSACASGAVLAKKLGLLTVGQYYYIVYLLH